MSTFDITTYGAIGDGAANDAPAIQAAIDACSAAGGGTVLVPAGKTFLSQTITLKDNVELHIERGASLVAWHEITGLQRFAVSALSAGELDEDNDLSGMFITAKDAHNVAITGYGTIDGNGRAYIDSDTGYIYKCSNARPFTVFLIGCTNVTMRDVTLVDAALWGVRLTGCEDVLIHSIRIDFDLKFPNADGIDLDRCRRVRVSDCDISCGDDAISLKTCEEFEGYGPTEDIVITNCVLRTTSSAVVVGVDAVAPIRNVTVSNCVIRESNRGLSVNCGQIGDMENILFQDCIVETRYFDDAWWGHGEPIYVSAVPWHEGIGKVRNVRFRNILARSENGAYINGDKPGLVSGVVLEDVRIELDRWTSWPGARYDRRPCEFGVEIFEAPTSGIRIETADDVTLRNCEVVWGPRDAREDGTYAAPEYFSHAVEAIDTTGLVIEGLRGTSAHPESLATVLERTTA